MADVGVGPRTYEVKTTCFCFPPPTRKVGSDVATVPRLFGRVRLAIEDGAARLDVTYGRHGVPQQISMDRRSFIADEESYDTIRGFRRLKGRSVR